MADCKWINTNGGNWSTGANWSTGSAPTSSDNAIIDADSFSADGKTITIDATANCLNFDCSAADQNFTLANAAYNLNVYGNLVLSTKLSVSFTSTGYLNFKSTSTGKTITSNGNTSGWNRIYFDGVGGGWINQDDWSIGNSVIHLQNGTWNTNNFNITTTGIFNSSTSGTTRTLTLGSSIFKCGRFYIATNIGTMTFNYDTSTVYVSMTHDNYFTAATDVKTFYNLTIETSTYKNCYIEANFTVNNILTLIGTNATNSRLLVASNILGTQRTIINNGTVIASNVDFRDIKFNTSVDLSAITGLSGDCGGNSGITFTTAQKQYFKHTSGAVNWSDATKWFIDESPRTSAGRVPLPQDDVQFDAASFTGSSTLTVNCPIIGKSLDMSGVNQAVTVSLANAIECYGSYVLGNNITSSGNFNLFLLGRGNFNINTFDKTLYGVIMWHPSGTYELQSNLNLTAGLNQSNGGTFKANHYNIKAVMWTRSSGTPICYMGSGTWELITTSATTVANPYTIFCETSILKLNPSSGSNTITFAGNSQIFNKIWLSGFHTGYFDIQSSNTIAELIIDPGRKVRFTAGTIHQIGKLTAVGTQANPITIGSVTNAQHTLNFTGVNEVECDYLNLSYSNATPANKFFAGSHSTNGGNNSGWIFADITRYYPKASAAGAATGSGKMQLIGLIKASAAGITMLQATFYEMLLARASASGIASASGSLHQVLSMAAIAEAQVEASAQIALLLQIQAEVSGQANAEAIFNWIQFYDYYFKASAEGISQANAVIQQLIHLVAEASGISEAEAELLVLTYPVEIFGAISRITTLHEGESAIKVKQEARSIITSLISQQSKVF